MYENKVKRFDWFKHLTSFSAMKDENQTVFLSESSIALEFLSPHFSGLNSVHPDRSYVDLFQPVALPIQFLIMIVIFTFQEIVKPMGFGKPVNKICDKLGKKDMQICELRYPKPYDYSAINFAKIKTKELKSILSKWGEVCKNCLEKSEFVARVKELMPKHVPRENWPADMKDEL